MRNSGVLLPISSLPSKYGIGTFSKSAYEFVDQLAKAGQNLWQILPLGPTGYGDSPYQSFSTFAGNPYYIDLDEFVEAKILTKKEIAAYDFGSEVEWVDYAKIYNARFEVLKLVFDRSLVQKNKEYLKFRKENAYWLEDYGLFMAVKNFFGGKSYIEWDMDIRLRQEDAMKKYKKQFAGEISFYCFLQYVFAKQWKKLKAYANKKKISIIGDIPIYVAFDSADTWANPELFQLDKKGIPTRVAGCPPDAFSKTGQLWGNPLYRWSYHKKTNYEWWLRRIAYCYEIYDVVRIDHFRGFDEYYAIPYGDKTAEFGRWEKGPGYDIFAAMKRVLGDKKVIAEDLGFLTDSVRSLVAKTGYPGMKILQFAFDSREESDYLPHNYVRNCVVYTGTHDNDTTRSWFSTFAKKDKEFAKRYLNIDSEEEVEWHFIRAALSSVADTAIIPMQDYLGLGAKGRINTPSTLGENWKWRMLDGAFTNDLAKRMRELTKLYSRGYSK